MENLYSLKKEKKFKLVNFISLENYKISTLFYMHFRNSKFLQSLFLSY